MNSSNDFFTKMCKEATEELASGKVGWKEADTNTQVPNLRSLSGTEVKK